MNINNITVVLSSAYVRPRVLVSSCLIRMQKDVMSFCKLKGCYEK